MAEPREKPKETSQITAQPAEGVPEGEQEWIFTVNNASGDIVKIEKLDKSKGQRQEVSQEQYAAMIGYDPYAAAYYAAYGSYDPYAAYYGYDPYYEQAYYQGAADYATALEVHASYGYSPIEQAYYQGMADYAAALT